MADSCETSFVITAYNALKDVQRCVNSLLRFEAGQDFEIVAVDNGSTDGTSEWLEELARTNSRVRVIHTDHVIGEAAVKNIGLKQARGRIVVIVAPWVEVRGEVLASITSWVAKREVGIVGPWGVRTNDLHRFHALRKPGLADAMQDYMFAFKRSLLPKVGLMRECFRFYRNLDLDFSFQVKDKGYLVVADPSLPVVKHAHKGWLALEEDEREAMSRKNFNRFLDRWRGRFDLLSSRQTTRGSGLALEPEIE
jgi:glycosyltransferase involved in cell wall biosynthesis